MILQVNFFKIFIKNGIKCPIHPHKGTYYYYPSLTTEINII